MINRRELMAVVPASFLWWAIAEPAPDWPEGYPARVTPADVIRRGHTGKLRCLFNGRDVTMDCQWAERNRCWLLEPRLPGGGRKIVTSTGRDLSKKEETGRRLAPDEECFVAGGIHYGNVELVLV